MGLLYNIETIIFPHNLMYCLHIYASLEGMQFI
jgi:hypothetical protein